MTPVLMLLLGVNPLVAVGTDLLYSVPTKILGAVVHAKQRTMDWSAARGLLLGGIPGVIAGLIALYALRHSVDAQLLNAIVKRAVGIALIVSAIALVYGAIMYRKADTPAEGDSSDLIRRRTPALAASGALVGFFVALTSIGSGAITMPLLLLIVPLIGLRRLVGTDIAFAAFLIPVAAFGHITLGDVNYRVALSLLIGSLPGVFIGSRLCRNLSEIWLRPAVAMVLVIAGSRLI